MKIVTHEPPSAAHDCHGKAKLNYSDGKATVEDTSHDTSPQENTSDACKTEGSEQFMSAL